MLGPHASLCVHASRDTPSFTMVRTCTLQGRKQSLYYYNVVMVTIPKRVSNINNYQRMLAGQKRGLRGVQTD